MKTAIVTGAYGAIGTEISKGLVDHGFFTMLVGRNIEKLRSMQSMFQEGKNIPTCSIHVVDLSSKKAIFDFASSVNQKIDVLINNAATAPVRRTESDDGTEMQWATNVLSYFWMSMALKGQLLQAEKPLIINVASYWAGGLDLDDPEFKNRRYDNDQAYRQSKQADRMLTYGLAEKFKGKIDLVACHPGDANSKLSNDLGFGGSESARKAAEMPLSLAIDKPGLSVTSGAYYAHGRMANCQFRSDREGIKRLLEICERY